MSAEGRAQEGRAKRIRSGLEADYFCDEISAAGKADETRAALCLRLGLPITPRAEAKPAPLPPPPPLPSVEPPAMAGQPDMVSLPGGTFVMGSPNEKEDRDEFREVQKTVTVAPFLIGKYDVTFAQWDMCTADGACPKADDEDCGRGDRPVGNVSWQDAQKYIAWLSKKTGRSYRLPTNIEWEYAARAGTKTMYYWGASLEQNKANCTECGVSEEDAGPTPVGKFPPNAFGLYDMAGNVSQWMSDCFYDLTGPGKSGPCIQRATRGGSWVSDPPELRSAAIFRYKSDTRESYIGFRIARSE